MADSGYHVAVDIDDATSFIYALTNSFKSIIETVAEKQLTLKEKLAKGETVSAAEVFAAKAEPTDEVPFEQTVTIYKKDWEQLVKLAQLFREHPEATEGYKISVGADLAGTVCYVNEHVEK